MDAERETGGGQAPQGFARILRRLGAGEAGIRLAGGAAAIFAMRGFLILATFIITVVLSRSLGAEGFGVYAYAMAWVQFLLLPALLGGDRLVVREVVRLRVAEEWSLLRGLMLRAHQGVAGSALLLGIAGFGAALAFEPVLRPLWSAPILLLMMALLRLRQTVLLGMERQEQSLLGEAVVQPGFFLAAWGVLTLAGWGPLEARLAIHLQAVAAAVALAVAWVLSARALPVQIRSVRARSRVRPWLAAGMPMMLVAAIQVLNGRADILMVGALMDPADVGVYAVANRGAMLVNVLYVAVSAAIAPSLAALHEKGQKERMQNLLLRATSATTLATLPVAALLAIFSTTFLALFGPEFTAARQPMLVMIGGMVLVTAAGPVYALLMMTGLEKQAAVAAGLSTAANLALNLLLIPRLGTMGAAVALVVGQVGAAAALLLLVRRRLGITLLWWLPARWTRP